MRQLTKSQKKVIDSWIKDNMPWLHSESVRFNLEDWVAGGDFPIQKLEEINDTEILYQEVNRYVRDYLGSINQETADMVREEGR